LEVKTISSNSTITATGAIAVGTAASVGMGAANMISGSKQQSRAQRALDEQARNSPLYKRDKSLDQFILEARNRYKENPYQSKQYQVGAQNIQRSTAQAISGLQDRKAAIGSVGKLALGQNMAMQNLGAQAESSQQQRFGQYGQATQFGNQEYQREFDFNKMTPYNRKLQLEQMKAQAAGEQYNAGMQTVGQGLSNLGTFAASGGFSADGFGKTPKIPKIKGSSGGYYGMNTIGLDA
jgi:hypothetical protein